MGNYEQLKQAVSDVIKTNGKQEITGAILQNALLTIISTVGYGATFAGIATPITNPGTPDQNVFYIAAQKGVYVNFGSKELIDEVLIFYNDSGTWKNQNTGISIKLTFDQTPTLGSKNPVESNGIRIALDEQKNEVEEAKEEAIQEIQENEQQAIANFNSQRVTPEMLSESTLQLIQASGGGTITNLADDEDLESVDNGLGVNVLKLKNRTYNPDNYSGKGYKIIRKNFVGNKNILLQEMINEQNTIYDVRYDFDLDGSEITIPDGCIINFNGGKIYGGVIKGNKMDTDIRYSIKNFISGNETSHEKEFQNMLNICKNIDIDFDIILTANTDFTEKKYAVSIPSNTNVNISSIIKLGEKTGRSVLLFVGKDSYNVEIFGNGEMIGETGVRPDGEQRCSAINIRGAKNVKVHDLYIHDFWEDAVGISSYDYTLETYSENVNIDNLYIDNVGRNGISLTSCKNAKITNTKIENCVGKDPAAAIDIELHTETEVLSDIWIDGLLINNCIRGVVCAGNDVNGLILNNITVLDNEINKSASPLYSAKKMQIKNCKFISVSLSECNVYNLISKELYLKSNYPKSGDRPIQPTQKFYFSSFNSIEIDANSINWIDFVQCVISNEYNKYGLLDKSFVCQADFRNCIVQFKNCLGRVYPGYKSNFINSYIYEDRTASQDSSSDNFIFVNCSIVCENESKQAFFITKKDSYIYNSTIEVITQLQTCSICSKQLDGNWYWYNVAIINPPTTYKTSVNNLHEINTMLFNSENGEGVLRYVEKGNITQRNNMTNNYIGQKFYNTTNKSVQWWGGEKWFNSDGTPADALTRGTFANRPTEEDGISVGFQYFCTDKRTSEGGSSGIVIYYKGNNIWIDSLGRTIS